MGGTGVGLAVGGMGVGTGVMIGAGVGLLTGACVWSRRVGPRLIDGVGEADPTGPATTGVGVSVAVGSALSV